MEVSNDIVHNFICDLRKMDVDPVERAKIVKAYMVENKLSLRKFCRDFGVPKSTANNWLHYIKIEKEQYKQLQDKGYSKARIREIVFKNQVQERLENDKDSDFDYVIEEVTKRLEKYMHGKIDISSKTHILLYRLQETIRKIANNITK